MQLSRIWHVSDGRKFPLTLTETGQFRCEGVEVKLEDLSSVQPASDLFHIFFIQTEKGHLESLKKNLKTARNLDDIPTIILLPEEDYRQGLAQLALLSRTYILDDSIRPQNLKTILELTLQLEYYRNLVYRLSRDSRQSNSIFENLLALARRELETSKGESAAYKSLLEYENMHKKFHSSFEKAIEETLRMKDTEMLTLQAQINAMEKLGEFREKEITDARKTFQAAEAVLEYSRKENMEKDRILNAMDRLRSYTDRELLDLYQENQELRKKLGMPSRD